MSNQDAGHLECSQQPEEVDEDAEFNEKLSKNFDVLPLFESAHSAYIGVKKYSLNNNETLRNRWHERVVSGISPGSKQMPKITDYHFHNCRTKFLPSESQANYRSPKFHLTPGPGVDHFGQRPIPDDMMMSRTKPKTQPTVKKDKTKKTQKGQELVK